MPEISGIVRATDLRILGVTFSSTLRVSQHVSDILARVQQALHALRILRAHGLPDYHIHSAFNSLVLSRLTYASSAWHGLLLAEERERLEAFLRKARRTGYAAPDLRPLDETFAELDERLFYSILNDDQHVLKSYLPLTTSHNYNLRSRRHSLTLPRKDSKLSDCLFLARMLYKDIY